MTRARLLALIVSAGVTGVLSLSTATAADAAVGRSFSKTTAAGSGASDGQAFVYGIVTWTSKTSFTISGRINDLCNGPTDGDGLGAYFNGTITYMDGSGRGMGNPNIAQDTQGCTESSVGFSYTAPVGKNVRRLNLVVQELDISGGRAGEVVRWTMDNPYTG